MGLLVLCFVGQTYLVYSDPTPTRALSDEAVEGSRYWHRNNCQACHQIYGFGGFLGPDLTNVATRLPGPALAERLGPLLAEGAGQMPAFEASEGDLRALVAFFAELDRTGTGQARAPETAAAPGPDLGPLADRPCLACHRVDEDGPTGAPALSGISARLSSAELRAVLASGRPPTMPAPTPPFSAAELDRVEQVLERLAAGREERAAAAPVGLTWSELPWWEYR